MAQRAQGGHGVPIHLGTTQGSHLGSTHRGTQHVAGYGTGAASPVELHPTTGPPPDPPSVVLHHHGH